MALRNLSVEEMVTLSDAWVTPSNAAHQAVVSEPRLSVFLGDLAAAHQAIYAVRPAAQDPRKQEVARLAAEEDALHDRLARGIHGVLTELAMLDAHGEQLIALRNLLMPEGVSKIIRASYRGQAGYAALLRERLTPQRRGELEAIPLRQGNMLVQVEAWLAAAERLGGYEEERARLEGSQGESLSKQTLDARNTWVRTVNAFVSVAALAQLDEAKDRLIFGPLHDAEAKADLRSARRVSAKGANGSAPTDTPAAAVD